MKHLSEIQVVYANEAAVVTLMPKLVEKGATDIMQDRQTNILTFKAAENSEEIGDFLEREATRGKVVSFGHTLSTLEF